MEYKYTESAEKELEDFKREQVALLEDFVRRRKYVYGDDLIEVTGSDVKEAKRHFTIIDNRKSSIRQLTLGTYLFIGIVTLIGGLFYEQIRAAMTGDPTQLMIILMGVTMIFASLFGHWWFRFRDRIRAERREFTDEK
mgnify:CR=1 FL=1|tara:strand:+ start:3588 stop:4001 length:414 start_codon:yes stop_codon:yes gene_type:complete